MPARHPSVNCITTRLGRPSSTGRSRYIKSTRRHFLFFDQSGCDHFYRRGSISEALLGHADKHILPVVLNAINSLDNSDSSVRARGATALLIMGSHGKVIPKHRLGQSMTLEIAHVRNILFEVCTIHASIRYFRRDISTQDADLFLQQLEYFGVLKEL